MTLRAIELRVPPVALVGVTALAMWLVDRAIPQWALDFPGRRLLALILALIGACVSVAGVVEFKRVGTTVNPMRPQTAGVLVVSGVYRWTRNPMYLGIALGLLGWAALLANLAALAVLPCFILYMTRFQIVPEERALSKLFGESFDAYRSRVRRWL